LLSFLVQRLSRHTLSIMRVYEALAKRESNAARRAVLWHLARGQRRRAALQAQLLRRLQVPTHEDRDSWGSRLWRWLLVHCGKRLALVWITAFERYDAVLFATAVQVMKESQAIDGKTKQEQDENDD
jgi:hypothetical protein